MRLKRVIAIIRQEKFEDVKNNITKRDKLQEKAGFYRISENTKEIDVTDCKTVKASTEKVLSNIKLPQVV